MKQPANKAATLQCADVFLSYSRVDLVPAKALARALSDQGIEVAMDIHNLVPGEEFAERLDALLIGSAKVVFFATPNSIESSPCLRELELAETFAKPILPVLASGVRKDDLPESLREIQYLRQDVPDFITQLAWAVQIDLGWERQHTEYEQRAARGRSEVIADRAGIDAAQTWLANRPVGASPISAPVRALIDRSRARLRRRSRSILAAAFVSLAAIGLGIIQYQALFNDIQLAEAAAKATEAETRARVADAAAEVALARGARAEVEAQAARAREAAAERLANLYRIRAAEVLMQEGERERALQELLDATEGMVGDPSLDPTIWDDVLISFERVLEDAYPVRKIGLGTAAVAFGSGSDVFLTHQFSGLKRVDLDGKTHHVSFTSGQFIYALKVLTAPHYPREMVFWENQYGLYLAEGFEAPWSEEDALAYIPNLGLEEGYRNWITRDLTDGRILIAQSYDPKRLDNLNRRLPWEEGQHRAAYLYDPKSSELTPVPVGNDASITKIIQDLEGRNPVFPEEYDFLEEKRLQCAGDGPGSDRYRLAAAILEDVNTRISVGYSHVGCQWHDGAVLIATINFASAVYRNVLLYAIEDDPRDANAVPDVDWQHSVTLDSSEADTYDIWDNVALFVAPHEFGVPKLTLVTYARRAVQVWYSYETHEFPLNEGIDHVVALGDGVGGALTKFNMWAERPQRTLIQFDVRQNFSEYLADVLPSLDPGEGVQDDARHWLEEPVCVWESKLDRDVDGFALWDDPVMGVTYRLSPRLFVADEVLCFYPSTSLEFLSIYWPDRVELYSSSARSKEVSFTTVETRISGGAPPPGSPEQSYYNRNTYSIFRTDIGPGDDKPTTYEVLRSRYRIVDAQVSPDGTRAIIATSDGSPVIHMELWSLTAGRRWRDLGSVHRWHAIGFPENNAFIAGNALAIDFPPHRILTLEESRLLAQRLLKGE